MKKIVQWLVAIGVMGFVGAYAGSVLLTKSRKAEMPEVSAKVLHRRARTTFVPRGREDRPVR